MGERWYGNPEVSGSSPGPVNVFFEVSEPFKNNRISLSRRSAYLVMCILNLAWLKDDAFCHSVLSVSLPNQPLSIQFPRVRAGDRIDKFLNA